MSKPLKPIYLTVSVLAIFLHFLNNCPAQSVDFDIRIEGSTAFVSGTIKDNRNAAPVTNFSLADDYAGYDNLAARFSGIELTRSAMPAADAKRFSQGEYLVPGGFDGFRYEVDLKPLGPTAMAHLSTIEKTRGLLALGDLLPALGVDYRARLEFRLPDGWMIAGSERFRVDSADPRKDRFFIGSTFREVAAAGADVALDGEFLFSDKDAAGMADEILSGYTGLFAAKPAARPMIVIVRLPPLLGWSRWQAETRGSTTVIMTADQPFPTQSLQRLHEQLRHELFHLWIPNALNLSGNYDWFFEGFALYQSLRFGVAVNRIRFDDFLDTLGRAAGTDARLRPRVPLLDASSVRWRGWNSQVYARGMLVAFLCDLAILDRTRGRESLTEVFRALVARHGAGSPRTDGNAAVLALLEGRPEIREITQAYVRRADDIDLAGRLRAAGFEVSAKGNEVAIAVTAKPDRRQRELLDKLGYNNWRNFRRP